MIEEQVRVYPRSSVAHFRWVICALLFFAATINYIDRQVIGILKTTIHDEIGWSEVDYSWVVFAFQGAYAIGLLGVGRLIDRIGTRKGFSLAIVFWSAAAMAHALAHTVLGFGAAAAHQGWSCNLFTTTSDMFPRRAVGSVVGIGGMAGAVGGMMIARLVGEILERTGSYVPIFIIAASAYLVALLLFHLLSPKLDPANL
ncbi:MAG TPA: MFS transporter [Pyrinomonadaceae bacterium]|nr:MFS transporter [Pyrinomonadaceae bacterium]